MGSSLENGLTSSASAIQRVVAINLERKLLREKAIANKAKSVSKKRGRPILSPPLKFDAKESKKAEKERGFVPPFTTEQIEKSQRVEKFEQSGGAKQAIANDTNISSIGKAVALVGVLLFLFKKFGRK